MKRKAVFPLLMILILLLFGCDKGIDTSVQISLVEADGFTVEQNGIWVKPGENAVFLLEVEPGLTVGDTDFGGEHSVRMINGKLELTLEAVQYPSRVRLYLTDQFASVTYCPNGGEGAETTRIYDVTTHIRPNTSIGTDLFTREGYTLTGWNTAPDGSGTRVGLGSRVTADQRGLTLYAQWEKWDPESDFTYRDGYGITITGYHGDSETIVIPETIAGKTVTGIAYNAFQDCRAKSLILPKTITHVAQGAFVNCAFTSITFYDNIESIYNGSFVDCPDLRTVYINAIEQPCGYDLRKESCYPDKIDLLIRAAGEKKLVCYGGCSMWYNLDGAQAEQALDGEYTVINLGLNGTTNSVVQMQIMGAFLEEGDILFHTPELSSPPQLMLRTGMNQNDDTLWSGLEYNYDLVALVDLQTVPNLLDSLCVYLDQKEGGTDYSGFYTDSQGHGYLDQWGGVPFERTQTRERLSDSVYLDPGYIDGAAMAELERYYDGFLSNGIRVYVGYACVNLDAVPEEQRENAQLMDSLFRAAIEAMDGPVLISDLGDYLYRNNDFYDTNYHLLTEGASRNTALWLRDLLAQMEQDGLWEGS